MFMVSNCLAAPKSMERLLAGKRWENRLSLVVFVPMASAPAGRLAMLRGDVPKNRDLGLHNQPALQYSNSEVPYTVPPYFSHPV